MRKYNLNIISELPTPLNKIDRDGVAYVSGEELKLYYEQKKQITIAGYVFFLIAIIFFLITLNELDQYWLLILFLILIGCILLYVAKKIKNKYWELNRTNRQISIPFKLKKEPVIKSIYNVKSGYYIQTGGRYATVPVVVPVVWHESKLPLNNTSELTTWEGSGNSKSDTARTWSFYIWYLDKNRPLPPGDLLDPFRKEDFQRRKAEGFPPPLFCSCIPTPEATLEEQAEREKYWKDEDYMFRLDRYKEPKLWSGFTGSNTPLKMEKEATLISKGRNPNNWELKPYPEFENFKYLPTAYAMRYEFDDGKIVYSIIVQQIGLVCTPPSILSYKKEIIR